MRLTVHSYRLRDYGMSKEGLIARQFMLGVVQTAQGLPVCHEVFDGNQAEATTLLLTLKKVIALFPHIRRLIVVADRGLAFFNSFNDFFLKLERIELSGYFIASLP